jgi:hypothetical protein
MENGRIEKIIQGEFLLFYIFRRFCTNSCRTAQTTGAIGSTRFIAHPDSENYDFASITYFGPLNTFKRKGKGPDPYL